LSGGASSGLPIPGGKVELAYAVTDKVIVLGSSADFVKHVLDTTAGTSIASNDSFKKAVGHVGTDVTGLTYLDITALRTLAEAQMPADQLAKYKSDVQPFLVPFDAFAASSSVGGTYDTVTTVVTVK